jgi:exonuclease SbcD
MKVLHTSDWHLGKKLYKKDRQEEHSNFLKWLSQKIVNEKINILIIAGDIFDSPIPPTASLRLYFDFLSKVTQSEHLKQILIISGNHDSGNFLEAPTPFLSQNKIKIVGSTQSVEIKDYLYDYKLASGESIRFALLPFFKTYDMLKKEDDINADTHIEDLILNNLTNWLKASSENHTGLKVLIGHHLFGQYSFAGSEQTVTLSGIDSLPVKLFKDWDILTLGHIHKKQVVSKKAPFAIYSGSPIAMRFSESTNKGVSLFTFDENGNDYTYEELKIPLSRNIIRIELTRENYKEKLASTHQLADNNTKLPPYVEITLNLESPDAHIAQMIRNEAKEIGFEIINFITNFSYLETEEEDVTVSDIYNLTPVELFNQYLESNEVQFQKKTELITTFKQVQNLNSNDQKSEKDLIQ